MDEGMSRVDGEKGTEGMDSIVLIGTAHVSKKSIEEVRETILREKPSVVAVELDKKRFVALTQRKNPEVSIIDVIKRGEAHLMLFQLLLSYFQRRIGEKYGVKPGEEMLTAIETAKEVGADVALIDRDITITFKRFWTSLSFFEKIKLVLSLMGGLFKGDDVDVDEMLKEDVISAMVSEFEKVSPNAVKVLIDERDAYMAGNISMLSEKYSKVVAVVGAGHVRGIRKYLFERETPDINSLLRVKKSRFSVLKVVSYFILALIALIFISVFLSLNTQTILTAFMYWFLINGVLSAIGAGLAGAHPLSILSAFLFAWLTSLNPAIAAGWVSGLVEAWVRKPTTGDLEKISEAKSLRDLMKNRFFRVLLVTAFTNIGSMVGTFVGIYYVLQVTGVDITAFLKDRIGEILTMWFG
jgi:pheromone shutdown-related protein TraB